MRSKICFILICSLLLSILILPIQAGDTPSLVLTQTEAVQPGQDVTLTLSLPATTLAGGFITLDYDASLFTLKAVTLLQADDALTLTYHDQNGSVNLLLDSAQNVQIEGALLSLTLACSEEIQPGKYALTCTVPNAASFYMLQDDGSTLPIQMEGCHGNIVIMDPPLPPCPVRYLACQETNPIDGYITVRLCALVAPEVTLSRGSYGFVISVTDADGTRELTLAGAQITDQIEGGDKLYTAAELGGSFYTSTLSVPSKGEVLITLTPYAGLNGQTLYAGTYTITYQNGTYTGTLSGT